MSGEGQLPDPGDTVVKSLPVDAGDEGDGVRCLSWKIPWRRNPLRYSCLENPMDRGVWRATVCGVTESDMAEWA